MFPAIFRTFCLKINDTCRPRAETVTESSVLGSRAASALTEPLRPRVPGAASRLCPAWAGLPCAGRPGPHGGRRPRWHQNSLLDRRCLPSPGLRVRAQVWGTELGVPSLRLVLGGQLSEQAEGVSAGHTGHGTCSAVSTKATGVGLRGPSCGQGQVHVLVCLWVSGTVSSEDRIAPRRKPRDVLQSSPGRDRLGLPRGQWVHTAAQLTPALELSGTFFALFTVEMSAARAACRVPCWEPGVGAPPEWKSGHGEAR